MDNEITQSVLTAIMIIVVFIGLSTCATKININHAKAEIIKQCQK